MRNVFAIEFDQRAVDEMTRNRIIEIARVCGDFNDLPDHAVSFKLNDARDKITYYGSYPRGSVAGARVEHQLMQVATRGLYSAQSLERNLYL